MLNRRSRRTAALALLATSLLSCGETDEPRADEPRADGDVYCAALESAVDAFTDQGSTSGYHDQLRRAMQLGPAEHEATWALMLRVSEEPFTYDNFNPAVDSYEAILPEVVERCAAMDDAFIDDGGRLFWYRA